MTYAEYLSFASEISELESILAETPVTRVIDRKGFEARLRTAREMLAKVDSPSSRQAALPVGSTGT